MDFELEPKGILFNLVSPGLTATELTIDITERSKLITASQTVSGNNFYNFNLQNIPRDQNSIVIASTALTETNNESELSRYIASVMSRID